MLDEVYSNARPVAQGLLTSARLANGILER